MSEVKTYPLLLNPKAGSLFRSGLNKWLEEHEGVFRLIPTESAEDAVEKAAQLAAFGEPVVVAAGGDGTLMNVARGLVGTDTALGILPCGTMNVFAREQGIGSRNFDKALEAIQGDLREKVDIFTVNGTPFLQMAGFGPDARIIKLITPRLKRNLGALSHVVTALRVIPEHLADITLTTDEGKVYTGAQIIIGNGKRYGGEAHLFADAVNNDGLLDAAVVNRNSVAILVEIVLYMLQYGATQENTTPATDLCRFSGGTITTDRRLAYHLDGDYAGTLRPGQEARIERLPKRLKVCVPPTPAPLTPYDKLMQHPLVEQLFHLRDEIKQFLPFNK